MFGAILFRLETGESLAHVFRADMCSTLGAAPRELARCSSCHIRHLEAQAVSSMLSCLPFMDAPTAAANGVEQCAPTSSILPLHCTRPNGAQIVIVRVRSSEVDGRETGDVLACFFVRGAHPSAARFVVVGLAAALLASLVYSPESAAVLWDSGRRRHARHEMKQALDTSVLRLMRCTPCAALLGAPPTLARPLAHEHSIGMCCGMRIAIVPLAVVRRMAIAGSGATAMPIPLQLAPRPPERPAPAASRPLPLRGRALVRAVPAVQPSVVVGLNSEASVENAQMSAHLRPASPKADGTPVAALVAPPSPETLHSAAPPPGRWLPSIFQRRKRPQASAAAVPHTNVGFFRYLFSSLPPVFRRAAKGQQNSGNFETESARLRCVSGTGRRSSDSGADSREPIAATATVADTIATPLKAEVGKCSTKEGSTAALTLMAPPPAVVLLHPEPPASLPPSVWFSRLRFRGLPRNAVSQAVLPPHRSATDPGLLEPVRSPLAARSDGGPAGGKLPSQPVPCSSVSSPTEVSPWAIPDAVVISVVAPGGLNSMSDSVEWLPPGSLSVSPLAEGTASAEVGIEGWVRRFVLSAARSAPSHSGSTLSSAGCLILVESLAACSCGFRLDETCLTATAATDGSVCDCLSSVAAALFEQLWGMN